MNRGRGREGGNGGRLDTETLMDVMEMNLQGKENAVGCFILWFDGVFLPLILHHLHIMLPS